MTIDGRTIEITNIGDGFKMSEDGNPVSTFEDDTVVIDETVPGPMVPYYMELTKKVARANVKARIFSMLKGI